jgi:hypothetical protein
MAKELKNINLYATTVMQSKRLIDAGIEDSTADMKYMWQNTKELQSNFLGRKKIDTFRAFTLLEPCYAIINDVGDVEILDYDIPLLQDNGERSIVIMKNERVSLKVSSCIFPNDIPAWSLSALLNLCPYGGLEHVSGKWFFSAKDYNGEMFETPIEAAVDVVCWFKEQGVI